MIRPKIRTYINEYKKEHPCVDCGETDIRVLQFDHRDPSLKANTINKLANGFGGMQAVVQEIEKCDVRCANCHQRKHITERM
jgi:hypothetical protein